VSVRVVDPVSAADVVGVVEGPVPVDGGAVGPGAGLELLAASVLAGGGSVPAGVEFVGAGEVSDCVGVAAATPGIAIAVPIPSATARAPVRPMYRAYRILFVFVDGAGIVTPCAARSAGTDSLAVLMSCVIAGLLTPIDLESGKQLEDNVDSAEIGPFFRLLLTHDPKPICAHERSF
jgi:hypothetical protein